MKDNWCLAVIGQSIKLVPYRRKFVETYFRWLQDPFILETTASEPMTLENHYKMQESWKNAENKCTFIVVANSGIELAIIAADDPNRKRLTQSTETCPSTFDKDVRAMIGDINLILLDPETYLDEGGRVVTVPNQVKTAEVDVMIAVAGCRRRGLGGEALALMMLYGYDSLGIRKFMAKISDTNEASIKLFERFGFVQVDYVKVFREFEYALEMSDAHVQTMRSKYPHVYSSYCEDDSEL